MVTVYVTLIIKGYKNFQQVPANLQPAVEAELSAMDLGTDGKPLPPIKIRRLSYRPEPIGAILLPK
ncbi:CD1375 family protein [Paenibacillus silviterrae]|uniref:CD1375 family protein n=1 Tax=Paenibacillus silviterrae TaxID=3242194 RepID=UPI0025439A6E|nr:CD1375 family protein [Paenibacillus chinjuensis]